MEDGPIKKKEVIEEEAIKAPLELADNFEVADKNALKFISDAKKIKGSIQKSDSINDMSKAMKQLADQEKQIITLQKQVTDATKKLNDQLKPTQPKAYNDKMKELTAQFKAARSEMARLAETTGDTSKEFIEATKKAGELQDQINDIKDAAKDAAGGSGIERFGSQFGRFNTQIKTLDFKGATTTLQQLAGTTRGLTFKEATEGVGQFGKAIGAVGKALLTNPIFLIAAAIALITIAVVKLRDDFKLLDDVFVAVGNVINFLIESGKAFLDWIGATSFALQKRTDLILKNAEKERQALQRRYDAEIALAAAAGEETLKLEQDKHAAVANSLNASINAINAELKANKTLTTVRRDELNKQKQDLFDALVDEEIAYEVARVKEIEGEKKKNNDIKDQIFALNKFRLMVAIETNDAIAKDGSKSEKERVEAARTALGLRKQLADLERAHELDQEKLSAAQKQLIEEQSLNDKKKARQKDVEDEQKIYEDEQKKRKEQNDQALQDYKKQFFDRIAFIKKQLSQEAELWQRGLDAQISAIKENVIAGKMTRKQGEQAITDLIQEQATERVQIQIDETKKTLDLVELSVTEREALAQKLYDLEQQLLNATYQAQEDNLPKVIGAIKQAWTGFANSLEQLFTSFNQNRLTEIQQQQDALDEQTKARIKAAGDNQKAVDQIQQQADAKQKGLDNQRKDAQKKKAQYDKAIALISAQIALSQAIIEAMTAGPVIGQALAIATAAAGAVQIAAIAARKIPSYEKGVRNAPGGLSRVSEKGRELVVHRNRAYLTPSRESFIDIPQGADIYSHEQTLDALASAGMIEENGSSYDMEKLGRRLDKNNYLLEELPLAIWRKQPKRRDKINFDANKSIYR